MLGEYLQSWWRSLWQNMPWRQESRPVWGDTSPNILGVCIKCGAVVLEGWHQEGENGFVCQRCAGKTDHSPI